MLRLNRSGGPLAHSGARAGAGDRGQVGGVVQVFLAWARVELDALVSFKPGAIQVVRVYHPGRHGTGILLLGLKRLGSLDSKMQNKCEQA